MGNRHIPNWSFAVQISTLNPIQRFHFHKSNQILKFTEIPTASNKSESLPDYETPKKSILERYPSGRFSQPMETVHSSSERNEPSISPRIKDEPETDKKNLFNLISM